MNKAITKRDLFDHMASTLANFYTKNNLEHMCALESQMFGNYKNAEQLEWLQRFSDVWERLEKRNSKQYIRQSNAG